MVTHAEDYGKVADRIIRLSDGVVVGQKKIKKQEHFLYAKDEVKPGYWAAHLKAGIELLGNKIMDRYSNISSPTPFTVQQ